MGSTLNVLVQWIRRKDMMLLKSVVRLNRDTKLGQNYMYWKEDDIASEWAEIFEDEAEILSVEDIFDIR